MKLLLTNDELHEVRGGSQIFIADLARVLRERGHRVAVYSWLRGSLADELQGEGVPVVASPRDCGFDPDLIHAQHHLATMTALTAFPDVPCIYHCHGYSPWQERPPVHPRILRYATMAEAMAPWIAQVTGYPREEIAILPSSVNLRRFLHVRNPGQRPRRALLYGNAFIPPELISKLRRACARCGATLDLVGAQFENATQSPQELLPAYDIVFAIGRSALEAMASGCAVVLFSAHGCGPMVRASNVEALLKLNFTVLEDLPAPTVKMMVAQINRFDPGNASAVTSEVRARLDFERACDQLEEAYRSTLDVWQRTPRHPDREESLALSSYLAGLGPYIKGADDRFELIRLNRARSKERIGRMKLKVAALTRRLALLERRIPKVIWRWLSRD